MKQIVFSRKQFSATKINLLHRNKVTIFSTFLQPRVSGNKMATKFFLGFAHSLRHEEAIKDIWTFMKAEKKNLVNVIILCGCYIIALVQWSF